MVNENFSIRQTEGTCSIDLAHQKQEPSKGQPSEVRKMVCNDIVRGRYRPVNLPEPEVDMGFLWGNRTIAPRTAPKGCSLGHQEISFIIPFNRFPSNYGSVHHKVVWLIGDKSDLGWLEYRKMGQKHEWDRLDAIFGLDEKDFFRITSLIDQVKIFYDILNLFLDILYHLQ